MSDAANIRLKPSAQYRALLIDALPERAQLFASVMADRGYAVIETVRTVDDALAHRAGKTVAEAEDAAHLVVLYTAAMADRELEDIARLTAAIDKPLLVVTENGDPRVVSLAIAAGASFCQPLGVNADRLHSGVVGAIEIHKRLHALEKERDQAVRTLAERKLIDRAKSILMATRDLDENEAFSHLQKLSMTRNTPMAEIARSIIEAKELLG